MPHRAVARLALLLALAWGVGDARAASTPAVAVFNAGWAEWGWVTLVDRDSFAVLGTASFYQMVRPLGFDPTGKSLLVMTWRSSPEEPAGFWVVDAESGAAVLLGYVNLATGSYAYDPDFKRLYLAAGTSKTSKTISVFDIVARKRLGELASVERMTGLGASPDGTLVYAFCEGLKHKKPKGRPGNLHVLDAMTGAELARLDAGQKASSVALDVKRGLAYVMGVADDKGNGTLTVLRGASVAARLDVAGRPMGLRFAPDGGAYLLTKSAVIALAPDGLDVLHTWELSFQPSDVIFDPGHDVMFVGARLGSKIAAMTMSEGRVVVEHATGSPGKKIGYGLADALVGIVAVASAVGGTPYTGSFPYAPSEDPTSMALGEGGATLYVLNPYTGDLTLFDVAKRNVVEILPIGPDFTRIVKVAGDPNLWLDGRYGMACFNTSTKSIAPTINQTISVDTARGRVWIVSDTKVRVVDLRSGETVGLLELPKSGMLLWFDDSRERALPVEHSLLHPLVIQEQRPLDGADRHP